MRRLEIRMVTPEDLAALEQVFPSEFNRTHADDLADQALGKKSFLVAWIDGKPAGHVLVNWHGARQPEPAAAFPGCPEIFRLSVRPPYRHRGIATALVRECESEAKSRGHATIGLGTDPAVPEDHSLYIRVGFADSGIGLFHDVYEILRKNKVQVVKADTKFLVKKLR